MNKYLAEANIPAFNKVFGGLPLGIPINLYGQPKASKTTSSAWMAFGRMKQTGHDLLFMDAEKGFGTHTLPKLLTLYNKENDTDFGIIHKKINYRKWKRQPSSVFEYKIKDVEDIFKGKEQNIIVVDIGNVKEMLAFVGMPHDISFGTKISLKPQHFDLFSNGDIWDAPVGQMVDDPNSENEFSGYILDSLTYLMKVFGTEQQSFPPRDTAQSVIINQLGQLLHEYDDMFGITLTHGSRPPANSTVQSIPVGGKAIGHGFKYQARMVLDEKQSTSLNTVIHLEAYRLPTGRLSASEKIIINNKGVF